MLRRPDGTEEMNIGNADVHPERHFHVILKRMR